MTAQEFLLSFGFDNRLVRLWMGFQAAKQRCQLQLSPYGWDLSRDLRTIRMGRQHFASVGNLAADFDQLFETLIAKQVGGRSLLDFSHIQLHQHRASGVKFELAQWPEPDAMIEAYLKRHQPTADDLVFDLGAGCGISAYAFSNLAKRVIAFEPDSQLRVILERNVARLGLSNVKVAKESTACFANLVELYGRPAFCKANLDQVALSFFRTESQPLSTMPEFFATGSKSKARRKQFSRLLQQSGFETELNDPLGVLWARRT